MAERIPGVTFDTIQQNAKRPKGVSPELWNTGLAVTRELMRIGMPVRLDQQDTVGKGIPNRYYVIGTGVTVIHMPHWDRAVVFNGATTKTIPFTESKSNGHAERAPLPKEDVIVNLKSAIVQSWR